MATRTILTFIAAGMFCLVACVQNKQVNSTEKSYMDSTQKDPHSFARPEEAIVKHIDLNLKVDFDTKTISGKARVDFEKKDNSATNLILDTRGLTIQKITAGNSSKELTYKLGDEVKYLGRPLEITIGEGETSVTVYYHTSPDAAAVQWLTPQQTAGKKYPFLFTQSEAILARTWVPCQDGPGVRFTYSATIQVPKELMAVMSASNPEKKSVDGIYHFEMKQPIPSYLLALAVGDVEFRNLGDRTGVYAEPITIDKAAWEFADMQKMLETAEKLYGPYRWDRYDVIVLPPSFPFGGMENPRLTFATPTILAGDRSLVSLVAHELAHSWSGNLVTNATWNDFWLNEGFTVYFENRIMEAIEGKEYADMLKVLGYQDLQDEIHDLGEKSPDTQLKLKLEGRDPDDGMTRIAYEKGNAMLVLIEKEVGREKWDAFLNKYFSTFAFTSMNTERFLDYLKKELFNGSDSVMEKLKLSEWIYQPGLPSNIIVPHSNRFDKVDEVLKEWGNGKPVNDLAVKGWSTHEWLHFIRHLPNLSKEKMAELDKVFHFTNSGNSEILGAWFELVIPEKYEAAYPAMKEFLLHVGRRKFIVPLYKLLLKTPEGTVMAKDIYREARPNYHPVATATLDELIEGKQE